MRKTIFFCLGISFLGISNADGDLCSKFQDRNGTIYLPNQEEGYSGKYNCNNKVGSYIKGLKNGEWLEYFDRNKQHVKIRANYKDGMLHGKFEEYYYKSDQLKIKTTYKNNMPSKLFEKWYESGQKDRYIEFIETKVVKSVDVKAKKFDVYYGGRINETFYNDNSIKKELAWHKNGIIKNQYENDLLTIKDTEGRVVVRCQYSNNLINGICIIWHPNGNKTTSSYKDGKLHGLVFVYNDNHKLKFRAHARNGKFHGLVEYPLRKENEFYDNGKFLTSNHYPVNVPEETLRRVANEYDTWMDNEGSLIVDQINKFEEKYPQKKTKK